MNIKDKQFQKVNFRVIPVPDGLIEFHIPDWTEDVLVVYTDKKAVPTESQSFIERVSYFRNGAFETVQMSNGDLIQPVHVSKLTSEHKQ